MSVQTRCDNKINELNQKVYESINICNDILDKDTYGHDQLTEEFLQKIVDLQLELRKFQFKTK